MPDNSQESTLDVTGLLCPLPVLKARKQLEAMPPGAVLHMFATDPMSAIDVPHFCSEQNHTLLRHEVNGDQQHFWIKRKP